MRTLLLVALVATATTVHAGDDIVVLTSGNRMTGEVVKLHHGLLSFSIDGADTVDIDWKNVVGLHSTQQLDVELKSGERLYGTLATLAATQFEVRGDAGARAVDARNVVRITPIATDFRSRTSGFIDLGFDFLGADDEIDLTLNAEADYRTRNYLTEATLEMLLRRSDDTTSQRRNHFDIGSRRFLAQRWFALGLFEAEENLELDLDLRLLLGAAMGRTLVQSQRTIFALFGGLDVDFEDFRGVPGTDETLEALAGVEWDVFEVGGSTELAIDATVYSTLGGSRVRFEVDGSLRRALFRNFYWSLNVYESYNSDPPGDLEGSDLGVSLTLGRSF